MKTTVPDTKRCSMCEQILPLDAFNRQTGGPKGRQSRCKVCHRKSVLARYHANRDHELALMRRRDLRRNYGIEVEEYDAMLVAQNGVCAICEQPCVSGRRLAVDHDHRTNRVRGLLCSRCNQGLGLFGDDPERMRAAIAYLGGR